MPELAPRDGAPDLALDAERSDDPPATVAPIAPRPRGALREAIAVSADVTVVVVAIVTALPLGWHTTLVGFVFLGATWLLVWRRDDETVRRSGLALGGLVVPGPFDARGALRSLTWALGFAALVAVPYWIGWRSWWGPHLGFSISMRPKEVADEVLGQLFVIALPEEAFYRGYLQSRLDDAWPPRWRVLGATVGPGLFVGAAIFAFGHLATLRMPARLAVFFPALLFGWLRARTGGVGASVAFHAICNVYSQVLGRGYGIY